MSAERGVIDAATTIRGEVSSAGDLAIHGRVEGHLAVSGELWVGPSGAVDAEIEARTVRIEGVVSGNITAAERIQLGAGARVRGDLAAPRVAMEPGAKLSGRVDMSGRKASAPRPQPTRSDAPSPAVPPVPGSLAAVLDGMLTERPRPAPSGMEAHPTTPGSAGPRTFGSPALEEALAEDVPLPEELEDELDPADGADRPRRKLVVKKRRPLRAGED